MSPKQKIEVRQSEVRERIRGLLAASPAGESEAKEIADLTAEAQRLEVEFRAASLVEEEPASATVDAPLEALQQQFSVARCVEAVLENRQVDGAEAELAAEAGLPAGAIPYTAFERRAVTPSPTTTGTTQMPPLPAVFDSSIAPWLGISMPTVSVGDAAYPVLTTTPTAAPVAKGAAAPETAGAFTVTTATPRRVTGSFRVRVEDQARLRGMEDSLRSALSSTLSDALDNQVLNGSASGDGTVNGLLNQLTNPSNPSTVVAFDDAHSTLTGQTDGLFAVDESHVRLLVGQHAYRKLATLYRAVGGNDTTFTEIARSRFGGVRATRRIAAPSSNIQQAVVAKRNPASAPAAVMPAWGGITLIRDMYSGAAKGEVVVTAMALVGDVQMLRGDAFAQVAFKLA